MSERVLGYGTTLTLWPAGSTASGSTHTVAAIRDMSLDDGGATDIDTTAQDTADNYRTFKRGLRDGGALTLELAYDPADATHKALAVLDDSGDVALWEITYASTGSDAQRFSGYVKGLGAAIPLDDLVTQPVSVKITGDPDYST